MISDLRTLRERSAHGFSLLEIVAALVVVGIIAGFTTTAYVKYSERTKDEQSKRALQAVANAQDTQWRTRGYFSEDPAELKQMETTYDYALGSSAAGTTTVSVAVSDAGSPQDIQGGQAFGLASLSASGQCLTLRQYQPRSGGGLTDSRGKFAPSTTKPCTGDEALKVEGQAW